MQGERMLSAEPASVSRRKTLKTVGKHLTWVSVEVVQGFYEECVQNLEMHTRKGDQASFYNHLKGGVDVEGKRTNSWHDIRDEEGNLLSDVEHTRVRLTRWFHTLLNTKLPHFDLAAIGRTQGMASVHSIGNCALDMLTETVDSVWSMANRKAVGPDYLPAKLLKVIKVVLDDDDTSRRRLHDRHHRRHF